MRLTQILSFIGLFGLTIGLSVAQDTQSIHEVMPQLVVDLSGEASQIWGLQAQLWLGCSLFGVALAFFLWILLNINSLKKSENQGDSLAKRVSLSWLFFVVIIVCSCAIPLLRAWLVWQ